MKYRYKMAHTVKIGDVLHIDDERYVSDENHPEVAPHREKIAYSLRVTCIKQDDENPGCLLFIDRSTGSIIKYNKMGRVRLANMREETLKGDTQ
jgi:hypothetical protein